MTENNPTTEQLAPKTSLIDRYEKTYRDALSVIDNEVKELIQNGQEMKGLLLFSENKTKIDEVHEALTRMYAIVYVNQNVLKVYGSKRLKQLNHWLKPILELVDDFDGTQENKEKLILADLREVGSFKTHPFLNTCMISELEYMLKTLRILIEPEFELPDESEEDESEEMPD